MDAYYLQEAAFERALEGVACGATREQTEDYITANYRELDPALVPVVLRDALIEAEQQGCEREDIDPSWYR